MIYKVYLYKLFFKCALLPGHICLFLSIAGCDFYQVDEELVRSELIELSDDIQTGLLPANNWDILMRLAQTSPDTRRFLGQMQKYPIDLSQSTRPRVSEFIENIQSQMKMTRSGDIILRHFKERPTNFKIIDTQEIADIIRDEYRKVQESNEVYAYEIIDKFHRIEYLCKHECGCYASKFIRALIEANADVLILRVFIRGGGRRVTIKRNNKRRHFNSDQSEFSAYLEHSIDEPLLTSRYFYHVSLIIVDRHLHAGVVDPIMFGDANIRSLPSWYDRIEGSKISLKMSFY